MVAGAVAIVLALRSPEGLRSAASAGGLVAALTPLVLGLLVWARRPPVALATSTVEQTDAAQRQLASQVLSQWRDEISVRQLDDPGPLAVRWRLTELDIVDRADHVTRGGRLRGHPRFTGRTDRIGEMAREFRELKRRRLVILGDPGMGKTTLALLLLRELLERAEPDDPVPVLLSMSDWDPGDEALSVWLARRLGEEYPALRATVFGPDAARSLVSQRRVLPILDGLDELPGDVRPAILVRLNESAADPLVLTCRTAEYHAAVTTPGGDALTGGAVIEPDPLTPADAAGYLVSCLPPGTGRVWQGLLASLQAGVDSPVRSALSTPLTLWLLRKVYVDTRADPSQLCDTSRFPTADTVVEHLLDHLVNAVISANPPRHDDEHPFRPVHAWDPIDATKWLAFLAQHMTRLGSRDFAWWHLHRAAARTAAVASGLIAGLTLAIAAGFQEWLQFGTAHALVVGPVLGLVFGLVVGLARGLTVGHVLGLVFGLSLLGPGVTAWAIHGEPVIGLVFMLAAAVPIVFVAVLAVGAVGFTPADRPAYADLRFRRRTRLLGRKLTGWAEGGLVLRFVPGFAVGLVFGGILGFAGEVRNGLVSGLLFGFVFGVASWLAIGVTAWAEIPITDERPETPAVTFGRDLRLVFVKSVTGGCALGVAFGVQGLLTGANGLVTGFSMGVVVAMVIALGVGLNQPSGRYLAAVAALGVRKQLPLRLLRFLEDAHRLGLLRQTGPVYQFRHARLQDRLAMRQDHSQPTGPASEQLTTQA